MESSNDDRNPVELLAEEFIARKRKGEKPTLSEYTDRYPNLACDIRDLFPALLVMEDLGDSSLAATGPHQTQGGPAPERIGDYRILREVGRGGMGVVYEAEQESLGRRVALKVLPPHILNDSQQVRRFEREARAAAKLHHTNIVPVFGVGSDEGMHYYVMQFIQGQGLDEVLEELKRLRKASRGRQPPDPSPYQGANAPRSPVSEIARSLASGSFALTAPQPLPTAPLSDSSVTRLPGGSELSNVSESDARYCRSVARIGVQVADALDYAHSQGILHRDIKPSNLLLDMHGTVWVTDFGLAKGGDADNLTHTGDIVGTIRYMAPERFSGQSDARADVYALGLTLYELLTLRPAFTEHDRAKLMQQVLHDEPPPLRRVNRMVPRDLETIIHKAMAREPERRYPTPRALADDLQRFIEDRPIRARRVSRRERLWRWCRRNPVVAGLLAALMLVFLMGFAGVAWKWRDAERQKFIAQAAEQSEAEQHAVAKQEADRATREAGQSRRLLYASDMLIAHQAWETGDTARARALLDRQWPQDGQADLRSFEWFYLWKRCQDTSRQTLRGHTAGVFGLNLSKDGRTLATAGDDGRTCIWDLALQRHTKFLGGVGRALSPDGKTVALGTGNSLQLLSLDERHVVASFPLSAWPFCAAFSPDGSKLAAGCHGGVGRHRSVVHVFDVQKRQELSLERVVGNPGPPHTVAFSPDGRTLASGFADSTVRLWDLDTGRIRLLLEGHTSFVTDLCFAPDGKTLASTSNDTTVRLWDTATGKLMDTLRGARTGGNAVAFVPDGKRLAAGGDDGTIRIWDLATRAASMLLRGHTGPITGVAFAPDGRTLISSSKDSTVKLWDIVPSQDPNLLTGKIGVPSVAFSGDGKTLAVADSRDLSVRLWNMDARQKVDRLTGHEVLVSYVSFGPGGKFLASTGFDKTLRLWDVATRRQVAVLPSDHILVTCDFSPDGKLVAASSNLTGQETLVWDIATRQRVKKLPGTTFAHFSPDGTLLAGVAGDKVVLWNAATWEPLTSLTGFSSEIKCLAFAPDGKTFAACEENGTIRLWDVVEKRELAHRAGHTSTVESVVFSPNGRRLATGGGDSSVKLWDLPVLQEVATLTGHDGPVLSVAFSPDGLTLASASADTTVRLWQATPPAQVHRKPAETPDASPRAENVHLFKLEVDGKAEATATIEGNVYEVKVTALGDEAWCIQLYQLFDDLEEGATYSIRFRAKADVPREIGLNGNRNGVPDWAPIGLGKPFSITDKWENYEARFQARDLAAVNKITFILGQQTGTVWIDDFTLTKDAK